MENTKLTKLEEVVDKLIEQLKGLKNDKKMLQTTLQTRDDKIKALETQVAELNDKQDKISERVDNLINSIEDWEKSPEPAVAEESEGSEGGEDQGHGAPLFT
ncbi:MAG TPA: hypothetical protein ENK33_06020 [Desulfobacterales bacterium]|nr:hypothetical protein [Desulfobacterales bacterium]